MHMITCGEGIKKGSKYNTGAGTLVWDFLPIFEGKRFEGLGSLGSGRCGAALPGNCCHTKTLPSPSTPWLSSVSWYLKYVHVLPRISVPWWVASRALAGFEDGWGWGWCGWALPLGARTSHLWSHCMMKCPPLSSCVVIIKQGFVNSLAIGL